MAATALVPGAQSVAGDGHALADGLAATHLARPRRHLFARGTGWPAARLGSLGGGLCTVRIALGQAGCGSTKWAGCGGNPSFCYTCEASGLIGSAGATRRTSSRMGGPNHGATQGSATGHRGCDACCTETKRG